ncbi:HAD family hydrolase [Porphyromonas sp. COT-239 OH1446]|uniref:KdsC family phosphatase n=1 Tax=Porphyromonas sp. COT-239 OH1446 TaxID=1515613 RepID=UPI00052E3D44|nr:HAD hydrolase family protein [Porphyromonas sp. COT-239 OH1446]KGN69967.1 3-deoxy-D-manno-octulosonate 8-phosphate phosphatase [Porphyromonas sp. COT-239 OH1446]
MSSIPFDLTRIKAFVLDMDGVVSATVSPVDSNGMPMRTVNVKDGYAMQYAVKQGYTIAIISGGASEAMTQRFEQLGVQYIYMRAKDKVAQLCELERLSGISRDEMAYIGDDIPDLPVMQLVALPCAPADAAPEVKGVAKYISLCNGGYGVVRDLIEQTLKASGKWSTGEGFGW